MMRLQGKRVLVTGADGFIGSHLAERLVREGCNVLCLAQYNSFGQAGWLDKMSPDTYNSVSIRYGDVRDSGFMLDLISGVDVVHHLAALVAIPHSYEAARSYVETNIGGTLNVLDACLRHGVPKVILTSTSEVYGTPEDVPINVRHPLKAQSPYAATKVAADQLGMAYAATYGMNVLILRPFNTYGPRQSLRAVIPTVLGQMLAGRDRIELGSLSPRRDFTYVEDTVDGFVRADIADTSPGETIQLGTGASVSVGQLVELCREVTGSSADVVERRERMRPATSEVTNLLSDPSQAQARLGWAPVTSLNEGLRRTAKWLLDSGQLAFTSRYYT